MSRNLQDQFIDDDEEETCPLCVEEFDLNDKCFRPCPCGYQVRPASLCLRIGEDADDVTTSRSASSVIIMSRRI